MFIWGSHHVTIHLRGTILVFVYIQINSGIVFLFFTFVFACDTCSLILVKCSLLEMMDRAGEVKGHSFFTSEVNSAAQIEHLFL